MRAMRPKKAQDNIAAVASAMPRLMSTMRSAPALESEPAAMGSHGLLMRSTSTSLHWLRPVMNTLQASALSRLGSHTPQWSGTAPGRAQTMA